MLPLDKLDEPVVTVVSPVKSPAKRAPDSPVKSPAKSAVASPVKSSSKDTAGSPVKATVATPVKSPAKDTVSTPAKSPAKSTVGTPKSTVSAKSTPVKGGVERENVEEVAEEAETEEVLLFSQKALCCFFVVVSPNFVQIMCFRVALVVFKVRIG